MSKVGGEDDGVLGVGVAWSEYIERKLFFNKKKIPKGTKNNIPTTL